MENIIKLIFNDNYNNIEYKLLSGGYSNQTYKCYDIKNNIEYIIQQ